MTGSYGKPAVNALRPRSFHRGSIGPTGLCKGRAGPALQVPEAARRCRPRFPRLGLRSVAALLVFERHLQLGAEQLDLTVLELHVLRRDLGDTQVAERLRRTLDGGPRRLLPRLAARADELDDLVDAVGGHALLPGFDILDGRTAAAIWRAGACIGKSA